MDREEWKKELEQTRMRAAALRWLADEIVGGFLAEVVAEELRALAEFVEECAEAAEEGGNDDNNKE